jgi:hypothetical protein
MYIAFFADPGAVRLHLQPVLPSLYSDCCADIVTSTITNVRLLLWKISAFFRSIFQQVPEINSFSKHTY